MYWDRMIDLLMTLFLPLVCFYHIVTENVFLNVAAQDASGLEKLGNTLLIPFQYIFAGKEAIHINPNATSPREEWEFIQRFDYSNQFSQKTVASLLALPPSLILGTAVKAIAYLTTESSKRYISMRESLLCTQVTPKKDLYRAAGLAIIDIKDMDIFSSEGYARRPGDENHLAKGKEALKEITDLFNQEGIVWWVDCGTCLGAHRYGGVIPWDEDIDIAVLLPDFDNVLHVLKKLDPEKYIAQDWSSRDFPKSYVKVYVRNTNILVDIYHFKIDEKKQQLNYILSLENNIFFPEWWKIRERRFKEPVAFEDLFPLKKATLDGLEVFVPNNTKKYLQRCYGENLSPAKLFDPQTEMYEKDLSHPYWQRAYVH